MRFPSYFLRTYSFVCTMQELLFYGYYYYMFAPAAYLPANFIFSTQDSMDLTSDYVCLFSCEGAALEVLMYVCLSVRPLPDKLKFSGFRRLLKVT